jgi:tryptophanyl-tRNA synthetase
MAADIALYKTDVVPVGVDQESHLEFTREIVRTFNHRFRPVLVEPQIKLTETPKVVGIDGQNKMSKSLDNHIELAATPDETQRRVMRWSPTRSARTAVSRPTGVCNVYSPTRSSRRAGRSNLHGLHDGASAASMQRFARNLNAHLEPFRDRRARLPRSPTW